MDNNIKPPIVSIIVPVYNCKEYLRNCLDSIVNQTFNDFEVILVDDGSIDGSSNICDEYAKRYNFKVFHNKNHGVAYSRNFGVDNSVGKFVSFIDADDYVDSDYLKLLYQKATQDNCDVCFCRYNIVSGEHITPIGETIEIIDSVTNKEMVNIIMGFDKNKWFSCSCWRSIISRDIVSKFNNLVKHGEDLLFMIHVLSSAKKISYIREQLYYYRSNENSITHKKIKNLLDSELAYYDEVSKYFDKKSMLEEIKFGCVKFLFHNTAQ